MKQAEDERIERAKKLNEMGKSSDGKLSTYPGSWIFEDVPYETFDRFVEPVRPGTPAWWEFTETDGGGPTYTRD